MLFSLTFFIYLPYLWCFYYEFHNFLYVGNKWQENKVIKSVHDTVFGINVTRYSHGDSISIKDFMWISCIWTYICFHYFIFFFFFLLYIYWHKLTRKQTSKVNSVNLRSCLLLDLMPDETTSYRISWVTHAYHARFFILSSLYLKILCSLIPTDRETYSELITLSQWWS